MIFFLSVSKLKIHSGREVGQQHSLKEAWEMVLQDPKMQDLTSEQKNEYISALAQDHDVKQHGIYANNATAARDVLATMDHISKVVSYPFIFLFLCVLLLSPVQLDALCK